MADWAFLVKKKLFVGSEEDFLIFKSWNLQRAG
jgi:hypothetical protein